MSSPLRQQIQQLEKAGWRARNGTKHTVWYCPCGRHQTLTPHSDKSSPGGGSLPSGAPAQIKRCLRDQRERGESAA